MCGINGLLRLSPAAPPVDAEELVRTCDRMAHRGPDGMGCWVQEDGEVALGHRRLAIIDPSSAGDQPMAWRSGRYRIVHNGEVYNYRELRRELAREGVVFRSGSDTEVILALFERYDLDMLPKLRGMYAFAIWDRVEHRLVLARDPYGIKPLYYSVDEATLRFASQVKALAVSDAVSDEIDPAGLVGFLLWGSVPEPHTIRRGVKALPAGHFLEVVAGEVTGPTEHRSFTAQTSVEGQPASLADAIEDSIRSHLVADVRVGSFLSAGLDSAVTTALAARLTDGPLTTLTVRFEAYRGSPLDEGPLARKISEVLETEHLEHTVSQDEFAELWPLALRSMDQPSIDGFNTFVVSKVARQAGLKVVLSGLGGDELLGGYPSFSDVPRWSRWARVASRVPGHRLALALAARLRPKTPKLAGFSQYGPSIAGAYFLRRGLFLPAEIPALIGSELAAEGLAAYDPVRDAARFHTAERSPGTSDPSGWTDVHLLESGMYLRNQLLRDADWASMAHGLELRVPFVDPTLRSHLAARGFEPARSRGKAALLRTVAPHLPEEIWSRPKSGFSIPVVSLLEGVHDGPQGRTQGADSRQIARRVLETFGVQLRA